MNAANAVITRLYKGEPAVPLAVPVIRHGASVTVHEVENLEAAATAIKACMKEFSHCRSVAVMGKTMAECEALRKLLKLPVITGREEEYRGGALILPVYLAKGLEFDAVYIANASAERYTEDELDVKLLYVAMTRALHILRVFTVGDRSELLDRIQ
jgi:DNA helicase-2/ATP-dependent DNA helicase PcrA